VSVTLRRSVIKLCPFVNEVDRGELTLTVPDTAPELHALAESVCGFSDVRISHEDYTRQLHRMLPVGSTVVTRWKTADWDVEVCVT